MRSLDRIAARHPILASILTLAIIAYCVHFAYEIDLKESADIRWQTVARSQT
jgi:heme/copper-type cytochrome/quinol oxidase subunit 4